MKKTVVLLILLAAAGATLATAQRGEVELTRTVIQAERQELVELNMELDDDEAKDFWPLYREYRNEMADVDDRTVDLLTRFSEHYGEISDAMAEEMLTEMLAIKKAKQGVTSTYVKKFKKLLPARKVAVFFQLENKMDAVVEYELAREVPLLE